MWKRLRITRVPSKCQLRTHQAEGKVFQDVTFFILSLVRWMCTVLEQTAMVTGIITGKTTVPGGLFGEPWSMMGISSPISLWLLPLLTKYVFSRADDPYHRQGFVAAISSRRQLLKCLKWFVEDYLGSWPYLMIRLCSWGSVSHCCEDHWMNVACSSGSILHLTFLCQNRDVGDLRINYGE